MESAIGIITVVLALSVVWALVGVSLWATRYRELGEKRTPGIMWAVSCGSLLIGAAAVVALHAFPGFWPWARVVLVVLAWLFWFGFAFFAFLLTRDDYYDWRKIHPKQKTKTR